MDLKQIEEIAAQAEKAWGSKTLSEFRDEADRKKTGIAFSTLGLIDGRRRAIVVCVTDLDQIALLERGLELVDDGPAEDWNSLTLAAVAVRTARANGLCFEALRDEFGRRNALVLSAADPNSIRIVDGIFEIP